MSESEQPKVETEEAILGHSSGALQGMTDQNVEQNVLEEVAAASASTPVPSSRRRTMLKSYLDRSARAINYSRKLWSRIWDFKWTDDMPKINWRAVAISVLLRLCITIVFGSNYGYNPNQYNSKETTWKEMVDT